MCEHCSVLLTGAVKNMFLSAFKALKLKFYFTLHIFTKMAVFEEKRFKKLLTKKWPEVLNISAKETQYVENAKIIF